MIERDRIVVQSNVDIKNLPKLLPEYLSTELVHYDFETYGLDTVLEDFEMELKMHCLLPGGQEEGFYERLKV